MALFFFGNNEFCSPAIMVFFICLDLLNLFLTWYTVTTRSMLSQTKIARWQKNIQKSIVLCKDLCTSEPVMELTCKSPANHLQITLTSTPAGLTTLSIPQDI